MGRYIDWSNVANKYADMARVGSSPDTNAPYIVSAEDDIDSYLASRYSVPFTPCPGTVRDLCVDLAYYKTNLRQKGAEKIWEQIEYRLKAILSGAMVLTVSGSIVDTIGKPVARRVAMVSSVQPVGGYSTENPCFFEEPQS